MFTEAMVNKIFKEEVQKAINSGLPIPNEVRNMLPTFSRAKSFLGQCRATRSGKVVEIKLSKYLMNYDTDTQLRETIAHELCHTVSLGDGHGSIFKMYANKLNRDYGYHIQRLATKDETKEFLKVANYVAPTKTYMIKCVGCGQIIKRARMSKVIAHPERFSCGRCNGKFQRVA